MQRGFPTPGGVLECDDDSILIDGGGKVNLRAAGMGPLVTVFRMIPVPTDTTSSLVLEDLIPPFPVTVIGDGNILVDFDASTVLAPAAGSTSFDGANFAFLWDGVAVADNAFYIIDPGLAGTAFDSFAIPVRFRTRIVAPTPGVHTLAVQWSVNIVDDVLSSFLGSGNLTVQTQPR